ncbi:MAG: hypothetical protein AAGD07_16115 [Planctomycetota bacterium]
MIQRRLAAAFVTSVIVFAAGVSHAQTVHDDSKAHYLLFFGDSAFQTRMQAWLAHHSMVEIRDQMHVLSFDQNNPLYRERYASAVPPSELPAILCLRSDGGVIYKASRDSFPEMPSQLRREIDEAYQTAREAPPGQVETSPRRFPRPLRDASDRIADSIETLPTLGGFEATIRRLTPFVTQYALLIIVVGAAAFYFARDQEPPHE